MAPPPIPVSQLANANQPFVGNGVIVRPDSAVGVLEASGGMPMPAPVRTVAVEQDGITSLSSDADDEAKVQDILLRKNTKYNSGLQAM